MARPTKKSQCVYNVKLFNYPVTQRSRLAKSPKNGRYCKKLYILVFYACNDNLTEDKHGDKHYENHDSNLASNSEEQS